MKILTKLALSFAGISLAALVSVAYLTYQSAASALTSAVYERLTALSNVKETELNRWATGTMALGQTVANDPDLARYVQTQSLDPLRQKMENLLRYQQGELTSAQIWGVPGGKILVSRPDVTVEGEYRTSTDLYAMARATPITITSVYPSPSTGKPTLTVLAQIRDAQGALIGILVLDQDLTYLDRIMSERIGLGATGTIYLVNRSNVFVSGERFGSDLFPRGVHSSGIDQALQGLSGAGLYPNYQATPVVGVYRWLDDRNLALMAEISQDEALEPARRLAMQVALLGCGVVLMTASASYLVARQIISPIQVLAEGANRVERGDLTHLVNIRTRDELGELGAVFNSMVENLRAQRIQLEEYASHLEAKVEARTADLERRIMYLNLMHRMAQQVVSELDLNALLPSVVEMLSSAFHYYLTTIFIRSGDVLGLAAARFEDGSAFAGQPSLELPVSPGSVVGQAACSREAVLVGDVTQAEHYYYDERAPNTRSELAIPLVVGPAVVGVLDLQSDQTDGFSQEVVQVLGAFAVQVAIAIQNARLYSEAAQARAEADRANRLKSQFLANMSHELRTPLNSVINFAYLLLIGTEGPTTEGQRDLLARIQESGRHLLDLINDILDLAKIEAGKMTLTIESHLDVREIVASVMSTAAGLLQDKPEIELRADLPQDLPTVSGDRTRLRQVLLNLLSNAAKFTEHGAITVGASADAHYVTVWVQDTGIGMAPQDIPKAFAEFVQLDGAADRPVSGTGLGLSISKRFVQMHGGEMWAESQVGIGSTFYFTIPVSGALPSPPRQPSGEWPDEASAQTPGVAQA